MKYTIYDSLDGKPLVIERSPSGARFSAFLLAWYLRRPTIIEEVGGYCAIATDGAEQPIPPNWRPAN